MKNPIVNQPQLIGKNPLRKQDIERGLDYLQQGLLDVGVDDLSGRMAWGRIVSPNRDKTYWFMRDVHTGAFQCSCKWNRIGNMCKHSAAAYIADWSLEKARNYHRANELIGVLNDLEDEAMSLLADVVSQALEVLHSIDNGNSKIIREAPKGFPCSVCNSHLEFQEGIFKCLTRECWSMGYAFVNLANPTLEVESALCEDIDLLFGPA